MPRVDASNEIQSATYLCSVKGTDQMLSSNPQPVIAAPAPPSPSIPAPQV